MQKGVSRSPATAAAAIDRGGEQGCPVTDQRRASRPVYKYGDGVARCDAGALELADALFGHDFDTVPRR
ncbi:MAG TPA: choice-of-anchor Q domain-containing protein [Tahibacter sp.]|nr:choice-of-anchor Q domain-containing protein [Tahibacter sp.]